MLQVHLNGEDIPERQPDIQTIQKHLRKSGAILWDYDGFLTNWSDDATKRKQDKRRIEQMLHCLVKDTTVELKDREAKVKELMDYIKKLAKYKERQ